MGRREEGWQEATGVTKSRRAARQRACAAYARETLAGVPGMAAGEWEGRYRSTLPNFFHCGRPDRDSPALLLRGAFRGAERRDGPRTDRSKRNPQSGCSSCDALDAAD